MPEHNQDLDYQLARHESELCRLCVIWQSKVRALAGSKDHSDDWGPSEVVLKAAAVLEVTERGTSTCHIEDDLCGEDDSGGSITDTSNGSNEDDGELLEEMEALMLSNLHQLDSATLDVEDDLLLLYAL